MYILNKWALTSSSCLIFCVTKMGVQRGNKTWFSLDPVKAAPHGLTTFQQLVADEVMKVIGYGDDAYVRISQFWRSYLQAPAASKPDPLQLLQVVDPAPDDGVIRRHVYPVEKLGERYNGGGKAGTGGPKVRWLKEVATKWIGQNHPELHDTRLMRYCRGKNIQL